MSKEEKTKSCPTCEKNNKLIGLCKEAIQEWRDGKRSDSSTAMLFHVIFSEQFTPTEAEIAYAKKLGERFKKRRSKESVENKG